jgi:AI-2 transport protein TqsA
LLVIGAYAVIVSLVLVIVVSVAQLASLLPQYAAQAQALLTGVMDTLQRLRVDVSAVKTAASSAGLTKLGGLVQSLLSGVTSRLTNIVFVLALLLFLSAEADGMPARIAAIATDRRPVAAALRDFAVGTRRYLWVNTVFGFIVAVFDTIALPILGVPLAILLGSIGIHHQLHSQRWIHPGSDPAGAARSALRRGWELMVWVVVIYCVAEPGDPVAGSASFCGQLGGPVGHGDLRRAHFLGVGAGRFGGAARDSDDVAGQSAARGHRPAGELGRCARSIVGHGK